MKAIRIEGGAPSYGDSELVRRGGVEVLVASVSICGSDLHLIDSGLAEGRILGHEFAGTTTDGRPVSVQPVIRCGTCDYCASGRWHLCETSSWIGIVEDGAMAERIEVPPECLVRLPTGLDVKIASLVEPIAVAVHAAHRARVTANESVCVLGAGSIGLSVCSVLSALGIAFDLSARYPHQVEGGLRLGATRLVGDEDIGRYSVVFDAVGSPDSLELAVKLAKRQGRVCLVGSLWQPARLTIDACIKEVEVSPSMMYCEAEVMGHRGWRGDFDFATQVLMGDSNISEVLLSRRFPLEAATEGFAAARARDQGITKVVFDVAAAG